LIEWKNLNIDLNQSLKSNLDISSALGSSFQSSVDAPKGVLKVSPGISTRIYKYDSLL